MGFAIGIVEDGCPIDNEEEVTVLIYIAEDGTSRCVCADMIVMNWTGMRIVMALVCTESMMANEIRYSNEKKN